MKCFQENFPLYAEGSKDAVKVTYEFYGGETYIYFTSKAAGEHHLCSLKSDNSPTTLWEYLNQNYDMGDKWKYFRHIFKWTKGHEVWDLREKLDMSDMTL